MGCHRHQCSYKISYKTFLTGPHMYEGKKAPQKVENYCSTYCIVAWRLKPGARDARASLNTLRASSSATRHPRCDSCRSLARRPQMSMSCPLAAVRTKYTTRRGCERPEGWADIAPIWHLVKTLTSNSKVHPAQHVIIQGAYITPMLTKIL